MTYVHFYLLPIQSPNIVASEASLLGAYKLSLGINGRRLGQESYTVAASMCYIYLCKALCLQIPSAMSQRNFKISISNFAAKASYYQYECETFTAKFDVLILKFFHHKIYWRTSYKPSSFKMADKKIPTFKLFPTGLRISHCLTAHRKYKC